MVTPRALSAFHTAGRRPTAGPGVRHTGGVTSVLSRWPRHPWRRAKPGGRSIARPPPSLVPDTEGLGATRVGAGTGGNRPAVSQYSDSAVAGRPIEASGRQEERVGGGICSAPLVQIFYHFAFDPQL